MIVQMKPFRVKCQKCGYGKLIRPKGGTAERVLLDTAMFCPKCGSMMERREPSILDRLMIRLFPAS